MRFNSSDHVKRHMRTHSGEKPVCIQGIPKREMLTSKKPTILQYKCQYCDRAFAQSNDLVKHTRSHVGMNTYKCPECPLAFRLHGELRMHRQQHFLEGKGMLTGDPSTQEAFDPKTVDSQLSQQQQLQQVQQQHQQQLPIVPEHFVIQN